MTHRHPDPFVHEHSVCHTTAIDNIEPLLSMSDQLRETRLRSLTLLNNVMAALGEVLARRNVTVREVAAAYWQCCFALGLPVCQGETLTSVASRLGCERATISKGAILFCESNDLPANQYLKCESSRLTYREARIAVVIASANGSNGTNE
jgi:hypothetical protein